MSLRKGLSCAGIVAACLFASPAPASADVSETQVLADGTQRTTYSIGPLDVTTGQNRISYKPLTGSEKPAVDGWITRIVPNLVNPDGSIPKSSRVMFHHGVWINQSAPPGSQLFFATGEEKTNIDLPDGYGLRYRTTDRWVLNHMIHNLVPDPMTLYATYTIDFIPAGSPLAAGIKEVKPIWMDVESGIYPVFDVYRDSGGPDGEFTYPQDAENPYPSGFRKNEKLIPTDGVLVATTGHVHTGGLSTNLYLKRNGASYAGPVCEPPPDFAGRLKKRKAQKMKLLSRLRKARRNDRLSERSLERRYKSSSRALTKLRNAASKANDAYLACRSTQPSVEGNRVHLFESKAHYFHDTGPVSWDMAMYSTDDDWRVAVKAGDTLELQTTYETKIASWFESMGINVVYMAEEEGGDNPYEKRVDYEGVLNHGHYEENNDHGGTGPVVGPDPRTLPDGLLSGGPFKIGGYNYEAGDFRLPGALGRPPVIRKGQTFTFELAAGDASQEIWHSVTSCKAPCNRSTGISYPIPDGEFQFDSGQLGMGGPPTVGRNTWTTPTNLPVGTHTFFCRIHPLMRGAIRVKP
jgi:plastocyanin